MAGRGRGAQSLIMKPLPVDLWGAHEETKKKKGAADGETAWYITMLEHVATAAWWARKEPTTKHVQALADALDEWDRVMGWDGTIRRGFDE